MAAQQRHSILISRCRSKLSQVGPFCVTNGKPVEHSLVSGQAQAPRKLARLGLSMNSDKEAGWAVKFGLACIASLNRIYYDTD